jgi:hypothetical protein
MKNGLASPSKFLRVALESFRDDERVAFGLLRWLEAEKPEPCLP